MIRSIAKLMSVSGLLMAAAAFAADHDALVAMVADPDTRLGVAQTDGTLWADGMAWVPVSSQAAPSGVHAAAADATADQLVGAYLRAKATDAPMSVADDSFAGAVRAASRGASSPALRAPNSAVAVRQPGGLLWSRGAIYAPAAALPTPTASTRGASMTDMVESRLGPINVTRAIIWFPDDGSEK